MKKETPGKLNLIRVEGQLPDALIRGVSLSSNLHLGLEKSALTLW